jgi:hypothetical protein
MLPIGGKGPSNENYSTKIGQTKVRFRFCFLSWGFYVDSFEDLNKISTVHVGRFFRQSSRKI